MLPVVRAENVTEALVRTSNHSLFSTALLVGTRHVSLVCDTNIFSMADTIITNTPGSTTDDSSAGLVVSLVVIVALMVAGVMMYQNGYFQTKAADTTNVNVTVPTPETPVHVPETAAN